MSARSDAHEALVERLAEAIHEGQHGCHCGMPNSRDRATARSVLPLVEAHAAAEVEAAVTATRAEMDDDVRVLTLQHSTALSGYEGMRAERDALREKVTRVEALIPEWRGNAHVAPEWGVTADRLAAALSDPTTPDRQANSKVAPSLELDACVIDSNCRNWCRAHDARWSPLRYKCDRAALSDPTTPAPPSNTDVQHVGSDQGGTT